MAVNAKRRSAEDHPVYWFALLGTAREQNDRDGVQRARDQLRRLGVAVEFGGDNAGASILTLAIAARSLGVPSSWLREEALAGRIPHLNAGGKLVFNLAAVQAALATRAAGVANETEVAHAAQ